MFCHQCEQAAKGVGCDVMGVCGKNPEVAALQDNLLYGLKGVAFFADKARSLGLGQLYVLTTQTADWFV